MNLGFFMHDYGKIVYMTNSDQILGFSRKLLIYLKIQIASSLLSCFIWERFSELEEKLDHTANQLSLIVTLYPSRWRHLKPFPITYESNISSSFERN